MSLKYLWDADDAEKMYGKLRAINPHLPEPHLVRPRFKITAGADEMSVITLKVFIKLPVEDS